MIKTISVNRQARFIKPRIKELEILINDQTIGILEKNSVFRFKYISEKAPLLGLHYSDRAKIYQSLNLPYIFAQYFPEGFLETYLNSKYPFSDAPFQDDEMLRLAIFGRETLGRIRVRCSDPIFNEWIESLEQPSNLLNVQDLLGDLTEQNFDDYLNNILAKGRFVTVSGVQKKMSVATIGRNTKQSVAYIAKGFDKEKSPCLAANEYLCMKVAQRAGIRTAQTSLSTDSSILLVKRFDIDNNGDFLGMEDFTSLRDWSASEKYMGSYASLCNIIREISSNPNENLLQFFSQLACTCLLKNGDAHLKNFSVLYRSEEDVRLAPAYDILDTSIYAVGNNGVHEVYDDKLALSLTNKHGRRYPTKKALLQFGEQYCGVDPDEGSYIIERIQEAKETVYEENRDVLVQNQWLAQKWEVDIEEDDLEFGM
ncbi:TPA: type II toxin-antitoxin system HipA family toxin [Neisseria lactamica]